MSLYNFCKEKYDSYLQAYRILIVHDQAPSRIFLAVLMYDRAAIDRIMIEKAATAIANHALTSTAKNVPALAAANPVSPIGKSLLNRLF